MIRYFVTVLIFFQVHYILSQDYPKGITFDELYPRSLDFFISQLKKQKDSFSHTGNEKDLLSSAHIEKLLMETKYVLTKGEFGHRNNEIIPSGIKTINEFELVKKLRSNDSSAVKIYRVGPFRLKNGHLLVPVSIVYPAIDRETSLLTYGSNGNIIINYRYDCSKDVFHFARYGDL